MKTLNSIKWIILPIILNSFINANDENTDDSFNQGSQIELRPRVITKEIFDQSIQEPSSGTFIMYQAPWCGHCKRMMTTWTELAQRHNHQKKFLIGKIDCTVDTEFCSDNDILGYPTFIFYKRSDPAGIRYDGPRDLETMELFMFNHLSSDKNVNEIKVENIDSVDSVNTLTDTNFREFISQGFHFIKFYAPWCGHCQKMASIWKELAAKYSKTNVKVSEVDCTKHAAICQSNDVKGYPTLLFFHNGIKIENYNDHRTLEGFSNFIDQLVSNIGPNQEQEFSNQVIELNSNNFNQILTQSGLTFVKFYAPWCSHCKELAPKWIELASKIGNKVRIAEVDCTTNNDICANINGYPTLILFKNGHKLDDYTGSREMNSFMNFINKHLVHEEL